MAKTSGKKKLGGCAFEGCKGKATTTYHSFDHEVKICVDHREEWNAMCGRAAKADR